MTPLIALLAFQKRDRAEEVEWLPERPTSTRKGTEREPANLETSLAGTHHDGLAVRGIPCCVPSQSAEISFPVDDSLFIHGYRDTASSN